MKNNWKQNLTALLLLSQLGSGILGFILSLYVLRLSNSALSFSQVLVVTSIVGLISAYPIGNIVDKFSKNKLMLIAQLGSIFFLFCFASFRYVYGDLLVVLSIIILNVCLSICDNLMSTVLLAAAKQIVNSEDELNSYNSLTQTIRGACGMAAPLIAGAIYKFFSVMTFIIVEIIIESVCVIYIYKIKLVNEVANEAGSDEKLNIKELGKYVLNNRLIVLLSICMIFLNLLVGSLNVGYPFILTNNFQDKPFLIGLVGFAIPFGMLAASIVYQLLRPHGNYVKQAINTWSGFGVVIIFIGLATQLINLQSYAYAAILIASSLIIGFLASFANIPLLSYMQTEVPDNMQGRVFSLMDAIVKSTIPLSYLLYGWLFDHSTASLIYIASGTIMTVYMLFMQVYARRFVVNKN